MALRIVLFLASIGVSALAGVGAFTLLHPQVGVTFANKPPPGQDTTWACWLDPQQENLRCADLNTVIKVYGIRT